MSEDNSLHLKTTLNADNTHLISGFLKHGTPSITVDVEGVRWSLILHTGSSDISIMHPGTSKRDVIFTVIKPYGLTEESSTLRANRLFLLLWTDASLFTLFGMLASHRRSGSIKHRISKEIGCLNRF